MSRRRSPVMGKRYPLRTVCDVWRVPRSSVYAVAAASATATPTAKRGPKTAQSDLEVVALIRAILATSPFHSEGHRKVRVRLRRHEELMTNPEDLTRYNGYMANVRKRHLDAPAIARAMVWEGLRLYWSPRIMRRSRFVRDYPTNRAAMLRNNLALLGGLRNRMFASTHTM